LPGSRGKRDLIFKQMINDGYREDELARVRAPIGTNIGAETPEELAVSIVGELIQARAEREGAERKAPTDAAGACCRILAPGERV
jgi:xanthine dehydrogenase accessory factor